jgi:hypothetical protein
MQLTIEVKGTTSSLLSSSNLGPKDIMHGLHHLALLARQWSPHMHLPLLEQAQRTPTRTTKRNIVKRSVMYGGVPATTTPQMTSAVLRVTSQHILLATAGTLRECRINSFHLASRHIHLVNTRWLLNGLLTVTHSLLTTDGSRIEAGHHRWVNRATPEIRLLRLSRSLATALPLRFLISMHWRTS